MAAQAPPPPAPLPPPAAAAASPSKAGAIDEKAQRLAEFFNGEVIDLDAADGSRGVTLWMDERFPWVMVYSGDTQPAGDRRRAVAVEPMTCPPDALRTGDDLVVLAPGARWTGVWGITPR